MSVKFDYFIPKLESDKAQNWNLAISKLESGKAYVEDEILVSEMHRWGIANLISATYSFKM